MVSAKLKLKTFETAHVPGLFLCILFSQLYFNAVNSALYFHSYCFRPIRGEQTQGEFSCQLLSEEHPQAASLHCQSPHQGSSIWK